ncbi:MAG: hypothetical protein GY772_15750, partial [bacterium]|nr:hypothetical protein [bacterium]
MPGIWPKKVLEVEERPPRAGGGYYASTGQGYAAGQDFDPAPRDDPKTHLDVGWGVEQWWEKLRPRFGTLGGKRPEVIDLQTIGSTVNCRQQIDLSGNPGLKGDVDRDPALLAWRERASMALQAVARLCAPLQALQFALGEEALGTQVPRLLGAVFASNGIGIGATRLSPDEWVTLGEARGPRGGGHPLPPLSLDSSTTPMWVVGDSTLNLNTSKRGSTPACRALRAHYFYNMGWRTQAGAKAQELLEMLREWNPVECGLAPAPDAAMPDQVKVEEEEPLPPRPIGPPPRATLADYAASLMAAPVASRPYGAAGQVSSALGTADQPPVFDLSAAQGGAEDEEDVGPPPEGCYKRNTNFRGSATGPFIKEIPAYYQGDGSRPGVCICICNC